MEATQIIEEARFAVSKSLSENEHNFVIKRENDNYMIMH